MYILLNAPLDNCSFYLSKKRAIIYVTVNKAAYNTMNLFLCCAPFSLD